MIKEFKQIDMQVGDMTTKDFKKGFMQARSSKATEISFSWGSKMRLSDEEFIARIMRVVPSFTKVSVEDIEVKPMEHAVKLISKTGF